MPPGNFTAAGHGLRPGDRIDLVAMPVVDMPRDFWGSIAHVGIEICYRSVFDDHWIVESKRLGNGIIWRDVDHCAPQDSSADF